jgi:site-specific recombinase XerD
MEMKKIFAVSIILLFIGVAVAPSINQSVVKASTDDDLVEVTTQACGIKGYRDTTVKLTREQYQDLEQYLVEFRARLNQTSTREEAVPIFKEAVVELDKYGCCRRG